MARPTPEQSKNRPTADQLRDLYEVQRLTTRQIAAIYNVDKISVCRWLKKYGIDARAASSGLANRGIEPPSRDDLFHMIHVEHLSYREVAEKYGVDGSAIQHWLVKHEIDKPKTWDTRTRGNWTRPDPEAVRHLYESGMSHRSIGEVFGLSGTPIRELCHRYGIESRPAGFNQIRYELIDGTEVRSTYEIKTGNWLIENGIPFTYEPKYPFQTNLFADFLANDWYIEIWGVVGEASYEEKRKIKTALCEEYRLPLIEFEPWHFGQAGWSAAVKLLAKTRDPAPYQGWLF